MLGDEGVLKVLFLYMKRLGVRWGRVTHGGEGGVGQFWAERAGIAVPTALKTFVDCVASAMLIPLSKGDYPVEYRTLVFAGDCAD